MPAPPSVLFAASECAPFAKAGGLGDVVGALPAALAELGHDARVVLPRYGTISTAGMTRLPAPLGVPLGGGEAWCAVWETRLPGTDVPVYLLDHDELFGSRRWLYDPPGALSADNLARFTLLSRGALQLGKYLGFVPDVLHVHDWPTALVPLYLNTVEAFGPYHATASVLTIHNLAHAPRFPGGQLHVTGLPWDVMRSDGLEDHGQINPLKGGLYHATKINAVSPGYAREIHSSPGGAGLEHVIQFRSADVVGIVNGIDERVWSPEHDPHLPVPFSAEDLSGKAVCKRALQRELGLAERKVPLLGIVSRLTSQKGIDLVASVLERILALDVQMVVLGSGDRELEAFLRARSDRGDDRFRAWIGFHEPLSHRIEAASDLFLMPSRFEPCGLNQLYSQRYGTLPIVRATGGLDDTVEQYDQATGGGTGFKFGPVSSDALLDAVRWAVETYRRRPSHFRAMQVRAMKRPFGWKVSAARYAELYRWALEKKRWWQTG